MQKITYYSLIKEDLVKKILFQGTLKALLGMVLMFMGLFIPGILIIGWGLIPYRKIKKLQHHPDTIHLTQNHLLLKNATLARTDITKMEFIEGDRFGILIFLKDRSYFAPYFSRTVFEALTEQDEES